MKNLEYNRKRFKLGPDHQKPRKSFTATTSDEPARLDLLGVRVSSDPSATNGRLAVVDNWPERAYHAKYSVVSLAENCAVTTRTLQRFFIAFFGKTPNRKLRCWRMAEACKLLREGKTVKETACGVFFKSRSHFSRQFKEFYGFAPSLRATLKTVCDR